MSNLTIWLQQYKADKGKEYTHTSMGSPAGSYNIPIDKKNELIDLLYQTIFVNKKPVHLTEKPPQHTQIKADLDFKYPLDLIERKFTQNDIINIVRLYSDAIKHYFDVDDEKLNAYVFLRDLPYKDAKYTKDGIHLMYPDIICDIKIQRLIRKHVIEHGKTIFDSLGCVNEIEDIVDEAIISRNGWLMYGCSKPGKNPYRLAGIYSHDMSQIPIEFENERQMITKFSIRDHDISQSVTIRANIKDKNILLSTPTRKKTVKKPVFRDMDANPSLNYELYENSQSNDITDVLNIIDILSEKRADSYKQWIEVGLCLHNIDPNDQRLLNAWIKFSKKSPKFVRGECENSWKNFYSKTEGCLTIASLYWWARMDNPTKYRVIIDKSIRNLIIKSATLTTFDCANVMYEMYKHEFVCTDIKNNVWYQFISHKWLKISEGYTLFNKISRNIVTEYFLISSDLMRLAGLEKNDNKRQEYQEQAKSIFDATFKFRDVNFKNKMIEEGAKLFFDPLFVSKLNQNPDLLGFNNGVYDLSVGTFRKGSPEDYISMSVGYDYCAFPEDDDKICVIYKFLHQVFPIEEMRDYMIVLLASFLEGRNPNEKFYIWTGSGSNGKSKLVELFEYVCGQYAKKIPSTTFTQKRSNSSSASPEQIVLINSRFASCEEPDDGNTFNMGIIKEWTGGSKFTLRGLYQDQIEFKPQFKLVFCCNKLPEIDANDGGARRRTRVLNFTSKFVDNPNPNQSNEFPIDTHLSEKFNEWKQAFMYILLEHYKIYKKNGIKEPPCVLVSTNNYLNDSDKIQCFVDQYLEKDTYSTLNENNVATILPNSYITLDEVWQLFKTSDYHSNKSKYLRKNFLLDIVKKLGQCYDRPTFKNKRLSNRSVFLGWKIVSEDDETT